VRTWYQDTLRGGSNLKTLGAEPDPEDFGGRYFCLSGGPVRETPSANSTCFLASALTRRYSLALVGLPDAFATTHRKSVRLSARLVDGISYTDLVAPAILTSGRRRTVLAEGVLVRIPSGAGRVLRALVCLAGLLRPIDEIVESSAPTEQVPAGSRAHLSP
jgi:hypothetical protein